MNCENRVTKQELVTVVKLIQWSLRIPKCFLSYQNHEPCHIIYGIVLSNCCLSHQSSPHLLQHALVQNDIKSQKQEACTRFRFGARGFYSLKLNQSVGVEKATDASNKK